MNPINSRLFAAAALLLMVAGCATRKPVKPDFKAAEPLVQVIPPQGKETPRVVETATQPQPIYVNPVIEEVEMAPYVNDEGNLIFPGKMMVIREPGHWNLGAAQKTQPYFVPTDNQPPQLVPPSKSYYDYIQSKRNGRVESGLDLSRVRVLGYVEKTDQSQAQADLLPGETIAFDPHLGWLAIPQSVLAEEKEVAPSRPAPPADARIPITSAAPPVADEVITNGESTEAVPNSGTVVQPREMRAIVQDSFKKAAEARNPQ